MQTLCFVCQFFPKQLPQVVQWALDAEVRQGAQTNGLHSTRADPGEVGEEAKAKIQIPEFWKQAEQGYRPLGGTGSGAHAWPGYKTMEGQEHLDPTSILQPARKEWFPGLCGRQPCHAHPVSAMISGAT